MSYLKRFKNFLRGESGAVTVDFVVLTAGICFLSIAIVASVLRASTDTANGIGAATLEKGSCAMNQTYC